MISRFRRRSAGLVGLDIGSSAVKAVTLRKVDDGYAVTAVGMEPLPVGAVVDGAIAEREVVADVVRRLLAAQAISRRDVALSIAGNAVIVKRIRLPRMSTDELRTSIYWEAKQYIPFDIEDVHLDYQVLGATNGDQVDGQDVLLVAAKKDRIADYTEVVRHAGCEPMVMDVDAFAMQNAYEANYGIEPAAVIALLNIGARAVNVNVVQAGQPVFTRDLPTGGQAHTEGLQKELGLGYEDAELLKKGVPVDGLTYDDAEPVVRAVNDNLISDIGKSIDFYRSTAPNGDIARVILSGGSSRIEGFAEALEDRFNTPVALLDPFRQIAVETASLTDERRAELGPFLAVAVGLAMRQTHDR